MSGLVAGAASCVVAVASIDLDPVEDGWRERVELVVDAEGLCPWVDIPLTGRTELVGWKARSSLARGGSGKLGDERVERITRDVSGRGALRIHTPELRSGDQVKLSYERRWTKGVYTWEAGASRFSEIDLDERSDAPDWARYEGGGYWTDGAASDASWTLEHPAGPGSEAPSFAPPASPVDARLDVEIRVKGDPMIALYPGGGATQLERWTITSQAESTDRGFVIPLPIGVSAEVEGAHRLRDDSVLLLADADKGFDHSVAYVRDAETYGLKATLGGANVTHRVHGDDIRIEWEDDRTWYISAVELKALLPERPRLLRALDRRFRRQANPEPAVPTRLKGIPRDLDFVARLRPELHERTGVGWSQSDPLFPRKLIKARGTDSVSTVEAALILWTQLAQEQIPSAWGIVQPANLGPGFYSSPASYTEGVVGVQTPEGAVWIDPGCTFCGAFELRPHLEGASMLSPAGRETQPPTPGVVTVDDRDGTRTVELKGPPALLLREQLALMPGDARPAAIASTWCGPCKTTEAEGLGTPGEPIRLAFTHEAPPTVDPVAMLDISDDWHAWLGEIRWSRTDAAPDHQWAEGVLDWERSTDGEHVLEQLKITDRRVPAKLFASLLEERDAASVPADPPPESDGPAGEEEPPPSPTEPEP